MQGDKLKLIGRGQNGWHADGVSNGGNRFSSSGGTLEKYVQEAPDGCLIYDAQDASIIDFIDFVFKGPMVNPTLSDGEMDRFQDQETMKQMLPALGGQFKALGAANLAGLSSLDNVAPDLYIQLIREKVPGVKTGKVSQGTIIWD